MYKETKFIHSPLDERYLVEPTGESINFAVANGPPEEKEAHDLLQEVGESQKKVTAFDEIWSYFFGPTRRYVAYLDTLVKARELASISPEHRAVFCRMANNQHLESGLRKDIKRMIEKENAIDQK